MFSGLVPLARVSGGRGALGGTGGGSGSVMVSEVKCVCYCVCVSEKGGRSGEGVR